MTKRQRVAELLCQVESYTKLETDTRRNYWISCRRTDPDAESTGKTYREIIETFNRLCPGQTLSETELRWYKSQITHSGDPFYADYTLPDRRPRSRHKKEDLGDLWFRMI